MTMTDDPPLLAPEGPLSPLHEKAARIMRRAASNLTLADEEWSHVAAGVVLGLPEIHHALTAVDREQELLPRWQALDARHQPRDWKGSTTGQVCLAGCGAYPCTDRRILDGLPPEGH